jgi:uncharacterized RDD family membrane protein YckC
MQGGMNSIAHTSTGALSGSKLDNRRMLAALIDLAIVGVGGAAILVAAGVLGGDGGPVAAPLAGVVVCWALYYYFACESGGGQTLGKKLTRVRVVRVDGSPAGMREIAVRTALRVVDTVLVGLIAILATGERRARLGDLAAGTTIVSTDVPGAGPVATAVVEPEPVAAPELRPFEPFGEPAETPEAGEPAEPAFEELAEREPLEEVVEGEPVVEYEPITRLEPVVEVEPVVEAEPVADDAAPERPSPQLSVVSEPTVELSVVETQPRAELVSDDRPAPPGEAPSPEREPVVEVEVAGPEVDVDPPDVTVRSVETVSAIDLVMGADEPSDEAPAGDDPPAVA